MLMLNTCTIPQGTTVYEGPVAGGTGNQIFVSPSSGVYQTGTQLLPY